MKKQVHIFSSIPIIRHKDLHSRLKDFVTVKPEGMITEYSGVPPHIYMTVYFKDILKINQEVLIEIYTIASNFHKYVSDTFEKNHLKMVMLPMKLWRSY